MISTIDHIVTKEDLDELGHMNYMRYVDLFSRARLAWMHDAGHSLEDLLTENKGTVILHFDTTYHKELRLGDAFQIETTLVRVGTKSFTMKQKMYLDTVVFAESSATLVIMDLIARKAITVPEFIANRISK